MEPEDGGIPAIGKRGGDSKLALSAFPRFTHDNKFELTEESTKSDDVGHKDFDYYRDYYLNEHWRKDLENEHIMAINRFLEPVLVENSGYKIIPAAGRSE